VLYLALGNYKIMRSLAIMLIYLVLFCTGLGLRRQRGVNSAGCERRAVPERAGQQAARQNTDSGSRWPCSTTARAATRETADSAPKVGACRLPVPPSSTAERSSSAASSPCRDTGKLHVSPHHHTFLQTGGRPVFALITNSRSWLKERLGELAELITCRLHGAPAASASVWAACPPPPLGSSARSRATRESRWPSPHTVPAVSAEGTALATMVTHDKHENVKNFSGVT